jgi:hypothetical protein
MTEEKINPLAVSKTWVLSGAITIIGLLVSYIWVTTEAHRSKTLDGIARNVETIAEAQLNTSKRTIEQEQQLKYAVIKINKNEKRIEATEKELVNFKIESRAYWANLNKNRK